MPIINVHAFDSTEEEYILNFGCTCGCSRLIQRAIKDSIFRFFSSLATTFSFLAVWKLISSFSDRVSLSVSTWLEHKVCGCLKEKCTRSCLTKGFGKSCFWAAQLTVWRVFLSVFFLSFSHMYTFRSRSLPVWWVSHLSAETRKCWTPCICR